MLYVGPAASTSVVWLNTTSNQTSMSWSWAVATSAASSAAASSPAACCRCTAPKASGMYPQ